jgi:hypothetical protein
MTASGDAARLRMRRELLADALVDAARALRSGDDRAEALAAHVLAFGPLREQWAKLVPLTVRQRDQQAARRILAGLMAPRLANR